VPTHGCGPLFILGAGACWLVKAPLLNSSLIFVRLVGQVSGANRCCRSHALFERGCREAREGTRRQSPACRLQGWWHLCLRAKLVRSGGSEGLWISTAAALSLRNHAGSGSAGRELRGAAGRTSSTVGWKTPSSTRTARHSSHMNSCRGALSPMLHDSIGMGNVDSHCFTRVFEI
jgi:hypothetical protein